MSYLPGGRHSVDASQFVSVLANQTHFFSIHQKCQMENKFYRLKINSIPIKSKSICNISEYHSEIKLLP